MDTFRGSSIPKRIISAVARPQTIIYHYRPIILHQRQHTQSKHQQPCPSFALTQRRQASSSTSSSSTSKSSSKLPAKHTVLEQPDKFRPPSHGARLNARRTTAPLYNYGGGGYNQSATDAEREAQKSRTYPHMFPNEGTLMHWFLTNRRIHMVITLTVLGFLSIVTLTQSFVKTSPYAHLLPPTSTIIWHPISYIRESLQVYRLHIEYQTEQAAEARKQNILDAQKRRLYRRAHGMEDLSGDGGVEVSGIDVRGMVSWDDGLSDKERRMVEEKEKRVGMSMGVVSEEGVVVPEGDGAAKVGGGGSEEEVMQAVPKKKVKRWLGIWE